MTLDRIMAGFALLVLTGFLGIIGIKVGRADLFIAIAVGLGIAVYDLWSQLRPRRRGSERR